MTMAVKAVIDSGVNLKGDVTLEYVVDEELSGNGTLACILRGYKADGGISCETSSLNVQPACIGRIWFEIEVNGKPGWSTLNATFNRAASKARLRTELRQVTPNTLRHTFGTMMARAGRPMREIQQMMGHSTVTITEKWYAHQRPDWLRGATDVLSGTGAVPVLPPSLPMSRRRTAVTPRPAQWTCSTAQPRSSSPSRLVRSPVTTPAKS